MSDSVGRTWADMLAANPNHSRDYIERFRTMESQGADLHGEARLIDAMVGRGAYILDAGCGPGRVGGQLASLGHQVVGVDLDPVLIETAVLEHPSARWVVADLSNLNLEQEGIEEGFDVVFSAGNVLPFVAAGSRSEAVASLARVVSPHGRVVCGFGAGRGYSFDRFLKDAADADLRVDQLASTWDLRPFTDESDFIVAILSRS